MKLTFLLSAALISLALLSPCAGAAEKPDYSRLTYRNHPRLFFTKDGFKDLKAQLEAGTNEPLLRLHASMMYLAKEKGLSDKELTFDKATAKSTFNGTARQFSSRIISDAYAYRLTGEKIYLKKAIENIDRFADNFRDWTTNYWLENSELCLSFALAYDWLYKDLPKATAAKIVKAIETIGYEDSKVEKKNSWYRSKGNWNPVCNATLVCAAVATYEKHPAASAQIIEKALETVPIALKGYDPDGTSHEGPSYWDYANNFAAIMGMVLTDNFGTDFGMSTDYPGYLKGATCRVFSVGNTGKYFNYADCNSSGADMCMALWYFAWKCGRTDLLFRDVESLQHRKAGNVRALYMAIACAQRIGTFETTAPKELLFAGHGDAEVMMARSGWGKNDAYLALKGGKCKTGHCHMDEGTFVYEADGLRWADEFTHPAYELYRRAFKALRKKGVKVHWYDEFVYNNRRHSTLTINDTDMNEAGFAPLTDTFDTPQRRGGTLDLSDMFKGQVSAATRTAALIDGHDLEIRDEIKALDDKPALVRFTLVTPAGVTLTDDGIVLSRKDRKMLLKADGKVSYRTWSNDPKDYDDTPLRQYEHKAEDFAICGFEYEVPAGRSATMTTRIVTMPQASQQ